ncbi:SUN domain-containing protein 2-like [Drosophila bipectinata]|uniref:SUN domain-containing protein 2-like n=1 Tax=Drosophila bipectinata TaxID=42026 RepID=UPI0038B40516
MPASDKRTVKMTDASTKPTKKLQKKRVPVEAAVVATKLLHLCVFLVCITQTLQLHHQQQQQQQHGPPGGNTLQQHHRTSVNSSVNINISSKFNEIIQTATASAVATGSGSGTRAATFASVTAATTITPGRRKLRRKFSNQQQIGRNSTLGRRRKFRVHPYRRNATHATRTTTMAPVSATATTLIPKMQPSYHSSFRQQQQQQQQHVVGGVLMSQQQQQQHHMHIIAVTPRPQQNGYSYYQQQQQQQQQRTLQGNMTHQQQQQQQQQQQHVILQPGRNIVVYSNLGPIPPCPPGLLAGSGLPVYTQQQHFVPLRSTTTPRPRQRGKQILTAV